MQLIHLSDAVKYDKTFKSAEVRHLVFILLTQMFQVSLYPQKHEVNKNMFITVLLAGT
jgi:hypothetical protein